MKFLVLRKSGILKVFATVLAAALLFFAVSTTGAAGVYFNRSDRKLPVYRVRTDQKKIALSFDATYGADQTLKIMDILQKYGFDATFFLVGFWMDNNPEVTQEIAKRGFEIGTHSNVHAHMSRLTYAQCVEDLKSSLEKIKKYTGKDATLFRAPFGEYNNTLISAAESLGLQTVQWDVDSLDWKKRTPEQIISRVIKLSREGSIVLFHNGADHALTVLPAVLSMLEQKGLKGVKIGDLILKENYQIDATGEQFMLTGQ